MEALIKYSMEPSLMSKENDRIAADIACLNFEHIPSTLISTTGSHCDVWRSIGVFKSDDTRQTVDFVIKRHLGECSFAEARLLYRDYKMLQDALGDIVPSALFVVTQVDGKANVLVMAETVLPWFNLANPSNADDAIQLLRKSPRAIDELRCFVDAAHRWRQTGRIIDLYGLDNLILNHDRQVRYPDSFNVFFYEDMLDMMESNYDSLQEKISISLRRLEYLEYLLEITGS